MAKLTATSYDASYYAEHSAAGLDYAVYGDWQRGYGRWMVGALGMSGRTVLDVGCACGAIANGMQEAGAFAVVGVDLCEPMIAIGRERFKGIRLHVADAINLHLFRDNTFDMIHSAQVAEHWRPDHVPLILAELWRVARPGAVFFCCLDTSELFERQNRTILTEDPTHICIKPRAWWIDQLQQAGWTDATEELRPALAEHSETYFTRHDWDWFAARK